jgi:hypothetical protein
MGKKKMIFCGILFLVLLVGCGNDTIAPNNTASVPHGVWTPPSHIVSPLVGSYITTITKKDGTFMGDSPAVVIPDSVGSVALGDWVIEFRNDGYFTSRRPNSNSSAQYAGLGQYSVAGDLLTISDAKCWEFNGNQARTATYTWILQGQQLLLKEADPDLCGPRKLLLTSHSFRKQF